MVEASLPALWVDGYTFGSRILRGGEEPWRSPDELGFFLRDLAQLLSLELVEVPVAPAIRLWAEGHGVELASLGASGMERLIADADFRAHLKRGLETAQGALGQRPLGLSLPGPGALAATCLDAGEINEDILDDLALSSADLLRALFRPGLSAFRFEECDPRALEFYDPLLNVARHYEAAAIIVLKGSAESTVDDVAGFDLAFGSGAEEQMLPATFWEGADFVPPSDSRLFMELPADAVPETILAKLGQLRGQMA
ncbi:MAG: hypothetical protein KF895_01910 [Parvibaculum sp.]|nr:hypothetical protein [Parvibaculum sp.]